MQASILLFCAVSLSLSATVYGGLLVAVHPIGLEVNAPGDSVTLQCSATTAGEISHWLLNGAQLDPASLAGVDVSTTPGAGGLSTLTISSYQAANAGEYRCVARSLQGDDIVEVSHAAPVSHFAHRTFSTEPQDFTVYALPAPPGSEVGASREAAAFNCEFSSLPRFGRRPVIVWEYYRASTGATEVLDLSGSDTLSSFQYDHISYFQLHSPTELDDESRVRCLARHPEDPSQQVESQWATISISNSSRPDDFPIFTTQMPPQMHRIDGQQLIMGCSKSTPTTSVDIQWRGSAGLVPLFFTAGTEFIFFRSDEFMPYGHSNVLLFNNSIDGVINETFTCLVTVGSNDYAWNTTIVQPPPPLPPLTYTDQVTSGTVNFGSPGLLLEPTNYTGSVTWWFNGTSIPTDGSSQKYSISSDTLTLNIFDIVLGDAGLYQAELTDEEPAQFLNFQIDVRGTAAFALPLPIDELTVDVDTPSVLFDCLTDGNIPPVTNHSWTFNGAPISHDGSKYILYPNGSLVVSNVQLSDAGMYTCTPQNVLGSFNSSSITLIVNGGAAFVLPLPISEVTVNVDVPSVVLDCLTDGNIPPVTIHSWTFNGAPISLNDSKYILCPNGSLAVNNIHPSDAGMYTCTPQNTLGNFNSSSVTLIVNGGAAFVLPLPISEVTINIDAPSVVFDCLTNGNIPPVTNHSWTFSGAPISHDGSKYILFPNGSLAVSNVQPSDAGMYTCTPQNTLGSFNSSSITLIVNGPPGVPSISHVSIVEETSIFVNWTALDDVKTYTLEIRTSHERDGDDQDDSDDHDDTNNSNNSESIKTLVLDTNKHIIPDANFDVIYYFRVKATNDVGSSDYSAAYKFDPESAVEIGRGERRMGLRGWEIALIVIFIILILLLCCIFFVCVFICCRRENRTYYASKKEKEMQDGGVEAYRQTGEPDSKDD